MYCWDQRHSGLCLGYFTSFTYSSCKVSDQGTTPVPFISPKTKADILDPFNKNLLIHSILAQKNNTGLFVCNILFTKQPDMSSTEFHKTLFSVIFNLIFSENVDHISTFLLQILIVNCVDTFISTQCIITICSWQVKMAHCFVLCSKVSYRKIFNIRCTKFQT